MSLSVIVCCSASAGIYRVLFDPFIIKDKIVIDVINTEDQITSTTVLQLKNTLAEELSQTDAKDPSPKLEDSCLLSCYGIQHHSVSQLVMRLPGGWRD
uniref:Ubiquitin-like domain-containing protein n=1 Tax=Oncorhynchus kisutch TaxID=8019 RepID=A0A8C7G555_ONCKI